MKFDDASWHYGGDFPADLPSEAGATHTGMFVAWAMLNGLAGDLHINEFPEDLESLKTRAVTPGHFFMNARDGKFVDEDLNDEGNKFTEAYFDFKSGKYLRDYEALLAGDLPTLYHVPDSWETFDKISPVIARRFQEWKEGKLSSLEVSEIDTIPGSEKPWWKFW
jgi:hypothetical protein